jgi:hypothetical protein
MLRRNTKVIAVSAVGIALLTTSVAVGAGEGTSAKGGARNPSPDARKSYTKETEIIANTSTYGTRQSNKSNNGGGAVYGCRSGAGGTAAKNEPCLRATNLSAGYAFELATRGVLGGTITSAKPGAGSKPFTTNMTGVATGLNADQVDGKGADDITRDAVTGGQALRPFAQVAAAGTAGQTRGVPAGGVANPAGDGTYTVTFNGDLSTCGLSATITGADPGSVTVTPDVAADKKTTAVTVRTFTPAGAAADRAFHLVGSC